MVYSHLEPFGPVQDDLRAAWPTSLLYNANRKKDAEAKGPEDFFPSLKDLAGDEAPTDGRRDRRDMTPEEIRNALLGWVAATGGEIK